MIGITVAALTLAMLSIGIFYTIWTISNIK